MNYLYLHQLQTDVSPQMLSLVVGGIIGLAYVLLLYRSSRDNKTFFKTLLIVAIVTAVVFFVADIKVLISIVGGGKFDFAVVILAAFHTIELFIFQTHFFDNGYNEFFFGNNQATPSIAWSGEVYAYIYIIAFVLACITSLCLIIRAFSRRRAGREWLRQNKKQAEVSHVFFLESEIATILAKDIKTRHPEYVCILVGYPNPEEGYIELSLWEKFVRLFKNRSDNPVKPFDAASELQEGDEGAVPRPAFLQPPEEQKEGTEGGPQDEDHRGEAGSDVYECINDLLGSLYRDFAKQDFPQNCVLVTHGLTIRLFVMRFFHLTVEEFEQMLAPKNCDLAVLELQEDGHYRLTTEMQYSEEPLRYSRPLRI